LVSNSNITHSSYIKKNFFFYQGEGWASKSRLKSFNLFPSFSFHPFLNINMGSGTNGDAQKPGRDQCAQKSYLIGWHGGYA
jgi:hypothetical protein